MTRWIVIYKNNGITKLWEVISKLWEAISKLWKAIAKLWEAIAKLWEAIAKLWEAISKLWEGTHCNARVHIGINIVGISCVQNINFQLVEDKEIEP
jgi:hypothetical protein